MAKCFHLDSLQVFYRTHIIGFVGFVIFANIHVPGYYNYMTGALLLYVVDVVLRTTQMSFPVAVESSQVNSDGTITSVTMKAPKVCAQEHIMF